MAELAVNKTFDLWVELTFWPYPEGDPIIKRFARRAMAYPTMIESRLDISGGISDFSRRLSDWKGNPQAAVITFNGNDVDGTIRDLVEALRSTMWRRAESSLFLLSSEYRKDPTPPTGLWLHRGYMTKSPRPSPERTFSLQVTDAAGSTWFRLNPAQTLQTHFITRGFLEYAGIVNTPRDMLNKPWPILVGEHSNASRTDENGQPLGYGVVPAKEIGTQIFSSTSTVVPPGTRTTVKVPAPILSGAKHYEDGEGDSSTGYTYFVSARFLDGTETTWSNPVTIPDSRISAPDFNGLNVTNYNGLSFIAPLGWESYYTDNVDWFRIMRAPGGATMPTYYLDAQSTWDGTTGTYNDGEIHGRNEWDLPKQPVAPEVGTAEVQTTEGTPETITTDSEWALFAWGMSYLGMLSIFGPDLRPEAQSRSVQLNPDDPELMTPLSGNWPHANPWIDITGPNGQVIRFSGFYARGELLNRVRNGGPAFTVNSCGVTEDGTDATPAITEADNAWIFITNELILRPLVSDDGKGWNGIHSGVLVEFADGTTIIDTAPVRAMQAASIPLCQTAGATHARGYQLHWYVSENVTVQQWETDFNTTFTTMTGDQDDGQRSVFFINPLFSRVETPHIRQKIEIGNAPLPALDEAEDELETSIRYQYEYTPSQEKYEGDGEEIFAQTAHERSGRRDASKNNPGLELRCTREKATADASMQLRLLLNSTVPSYQDVPIDARGVHYQYGSVFRLTHDDGIPSSGYTDRAFFLVGKKYSQLDTNQPKVILVGRDLSHVEAAQTSGILDAIMDFVMQA